MKQEECKHPPFMVLLEGGDPASCLACGRIFHVYKPREIKTEKQREMKEAIILGAINSEGKLTAYFTEEYHKLLDQNRGRRIVMTISIMSENATISQKTYYDKVVLPSLQKCFNETGDDMTTKDTHEQALQMCPAIKDYNPDRELTRDEYKGLIDWAQRFCANEFAYQIPGPFTEIDEIKINSLTKKQTP